MPGNGELGRPESPATDTGQKKTDASKTPEQKIEEHTRFLRLEDHGKSEVPSSSLTTQKETSPWRTSGLRVLETTNKVEGNTKEPEQPRASVETKAKEKWNLSWQPNLIYDVPNEELLGLLTKYTGKDSRDGAEKFLQQKLGDQGKLTNTEDPGSRIKAAIKAAEGEHVPTVTKARRAFEEASFVLQGAKEFIDNNQNLFAKKTEGALTSSEGALTSSREAFGEVKSSLDSWKRDKITFNGTLDGTSLGSEEQVDARYKGYKEMQTLYKDGGAIEEMIAKKFTEELIPDLQKKQNKYETVRKEYGEDPQVFKQQKSFKVLNAFEHSINKAQGIMEATKLLKEWVAKTGIEVEISGVEVRKEINALKGE